MQSLCQHHRTDVHTVRPIVAAFRLRREPARRSDPVSIAPEYALLHSGKHELLVQVRNLVADNTGGAEDEDGSVQELWWL